MSFSSGPVVVEAGQSNQLASSSMPHSRHLALAGAVVVVFAVAGCGSASGPKTGSGSSAAAIAPAAPVADFPKAAGLTCADVRAKYGGKLAVAPGVSVLRKGTTRVPFLVLDEGAKPVTQAAVALYTMRNDGTGVQGPYPAREQPFGIGPAYLSRTTSSDPNQQKEFYAADVRTAGRPTAVFALVKAGGGLQATSPTTIGMKRDIPDPPDVGDRAIPMHTLTASDVAGDYAKVTTRVPPDKDMVAQDFADVLGKKPVVLVFATPALCQSRVCGPTVDVAEQVEGDFGSKVAWVHQEIYVDNDVKKGLRPQVTRWRLLTEPWVYVIGRDGRVVGRIEGAISVPELHALVQKAVAAG
jgi:hypothetical protein